MQSHLGRQTSIDAAQQRATTSYDQAGGRPILRLARLLGEFAAQCSKAHRCTSPASWVLRARIHRAQKLLVDRLRHSGSVFATQSAHHLRATEWRSEANETATLLAVANVPSTVRASTNSRCRRDTLIPRFGITVERPRITALVMLAFIGAAILEPRWPLLAYGKPTYATAGVEDFGTAPLVGSTRPNSRAVPYPTTT